MALECLAEPSHRYTSTFACTDQPAGRLVGSCGEVIRKPTSLERAGYGPCSLRNEVLPGSLGADPGGAQRVVLRSKMRPMTPVATMPAPEVDAVLAGLKLK